MRFDWLKSLRHSLPHSPARSQSRPSLGQPLTLEARTLLAAVPIGPEFRVNTYTTLSQDNSSVAADADGDSVVVWQSEGQDGQARGIYAQRYDAAGVKQGTEFKVNTHTSDVQRNPVVAMDSDGDFVVAWESVNQDTSGAGIYAQRFNAAGVAQGSEFQVHTFTLNWQNDPSIAMDDDGDFVVAWQSLYQDGDFYGIYAQRFNASGTPQGAEFRVNTFTTDEQINPEVAMDSDGDFVIVWQSYQQAGTSYDVYAQRYDAAGVPQGGEIHVNSSTGGGHLSPDVAMDSAGNFVIAWSASDVMDESQEIVARRFNASGTPLATEFRVNTYTDADQTDPAVAMDDDGDFVVGWQSYGQEDSYYNNYGQRYSPSGNPIGEEFRINSTTTGSISIGVSLAMDSDGDFVATWSGYDLDGDEYGIYAQRYRNSQTDAVAAWRTAKFYLDSNSSNTWNGAVTDSLNSFGSASDKPLAGDWNGDGYTDIGLWRSGLFFLDANGNGLWDGPAVDKQFAFGNSTDTPLVGDWNKDGRDDIGVWRAGKFYLDLNGNRVWNGTGTDGLYTFGAVTDTPIIGDWNGDGIDDIGAWRAGKFYLDLNGNHVWNTGVDNYFIFGNSTDTPLIGDANGDGIDDIGVWRAGKFYRDTNGNRAWNVGVDAVITYGSSTDTPLLGYWRSKTVPGNPPPPPASLAPAGSPSTPTTGNGSLLASLASLLTPAKKKPLA